MNKKISWFHAQCATVLPGPQTVWGEQGLGKQTLVQIQTNHVTSSEEAHHHTQRIEAQVTDGKVVRPPSAHTNKKQEVDS